MVESIEPKFTDEHVERFIFDMSKCKQGKEIQAMQNYGISDETIDLLFDDDNLDTVYENLSIFRTGCIAAASSARKKSNKIDTKTEFFATAKSLAYDSWINNPNIDEEDLSEDEIKNIIDERKSDFLDIQRRDF